MTHYELCEVTAKRFIKDSDIVLYDYQSFVSSEHPDVLTFKSGLTMLYEIKVDRSDFKADTKKEARTKWKPKVGLYSNGKTDPVIKAKAPELYYIEAPHLGLHRYFVCPKGLIQPEEVYDGWGLYWYNGGKFYLKKKSKKFRRNVFSELALLSHAFRRHANGCGSGSVLVNEYKKET